jgi:hypothetical protein
MDIALKEQRLTRIHTPKEPASVCPAETKVNGHFAVFSDGDAVKAEL